MIYTVAGIRTQRISVEVEADSPEEALEFAQTSGRYVDIQVWDTDTNFLEAFDPR